MVLLLYMNLCTMEEGAALDPVEWEKTVYMFSLIEHDCRSLYFKKQLRIIIGCTVLKIGLIGRLILFGDSPLNITLIAMIMRSDD